MAGVGALKSFLPGSPSLGVAELPVVDDTSASWHDADLGGGRSCVAMTRRDGADRRRFLILTSPHRALHVFAFSDGVIPDDPHVQESFPAPIELASIPSIVYEDSAVRSALPGVDVRRDDSGETVLAACLLDRRMWGDRGPVVAVT